MPRYLPLTLAALLLAGCASQHELVARHEDDKATEAFSTYLSARFAAGEHDLPEAARYYGQSLAKDPANPSLLGLSFFYSTTLGDFENAGKYARAVVTATPDDRAARLALAVIGFKHRDYADVRKQLSLSARGPPIARNSSQERRCRPAPARPSPAAGQLPILCRRRRSCPRAATAAARGPSCVRSSYASNSGPIRADAPRMRLRYCAFESAELPCASCAAGYWCSVRPKVTSPG
jgi:hypothetical protein